ncbi:MAG: glycoside hydrolase family 43 protein [Kiritimatiellales bacterium]
MKLSKTVFRWVFPVVFGITLTACAKQYDRFYPGAEWKDTSGVAINAHGGGLLYHNGVYYWYGEHKIEGKAGNKAMVGVHCYSSTDLYNWKDEGIALPVSETPGSEIEKSCILERPKVVFNKKTGKFVMWFHLEFKDTGYSTARSGVAVSDTPVGPFQYLKSYRPNAGKWPLNLCETRKTIPTEAEIIRINARDNTLLDIVQQNILGRDFETGQMARDMTVFVDDDGAAYHFYSSENNSTMHVSKLTDDYLAPTGEYVRIFEHRWMEAPAVCKRNGKYYLIASGCTGWAPNAARGAVAENIFGPWVELENPSIGVNLQNGFGPEKTFGAQSTYIQQVQGKKDAYIAMFDIWNPENAIDGRYVWLPIEFTGAIQFRIEWQNEWDLSVFDK